MAGHGVAWLGLAWLGLGSFGLLVSIDSNTSIHDITRSPDESIHGLDEPREGGKASESCHLRKRRGLDGREKWG